MSSTVNLSTATPRFIIAVQLAYLALIGVVSLCFTMPVWFIGTALLLNALFLTLCRSYKLSLTHFSTPKWELAGIVLSLLSIVFFPGFVVTACSASLILVATFNLVRQSSFTNTRASVIAAVKQNGYALQYADDVLRNDQEVVLAAVKQNGYAFKYVGDALRSNKAVVLAAVAENGYALQYADDVLRSDRDVVLAAVRQNVWSLEYANRSFRDDSEIILAGVGQSIWALTYGIDLFLDNREFMLAAAAQNGYTWYEANDSLRNDREFILTVVLQNGLMLEYVRSKFQSDKEVVLAAVSQNGLALKHVGVALQGDPDIVLSAVVQNPEALQYASSRLQDGGLAAYVRDILAYDQFVFARRDKQCHAGDSVYNNGNLMRQIHAYIGVSLSTHNIQNAQRIARMLELDIADRASRATCRVMLPDVGLSDVSSTLFLRATSARSSTGSGSAFAALRGDHVGGSSPASSGAGKN